MNQRILRGLAAIFVIGALIAITGAGGTMTGKSDPEKAPDTRDLWKKVEQSEKDGLPQTAIDALKQITAACRDRKQGGEFLRALTRQLILESSIQGAKPEVRVRRLKEEMDKAPAGVRPMLKLVLAQWYWQYFSRNKWRFMNRTATEGLEDQDFTTWDLPKIFREIDTLFVDILKDEALLKKSPLSDFADFLIPGNTPASLRPTVFDFAAFEALDFYTSGEQAAAKPEDAFEIPADSTAFGTIAEFLKYAPDTTDVDSPQLKALKLYQQILAFHLYDKDRDILLDADLGRLRFVKNAAVGEGISDRYIRRLKDITDQAPSSPLQSLALSYWAQEVHDRGDFVQAHELAERGAKAHPATVGASNCRVLVQRITAKEFDLRMEAVVRPGRPGQMAVTYRNVTGLHLRVVREDIPTLLAGKSGENLFWMSDDVVSPLLSRKPDAQWATPLEATPDFKPKTAVVELPALKPGYYRIAASFNKEFARDKNKLQVASFWVSDLGLITAGLEGAVTGTAVHNGTGEPLAGAEVKYYQWDYNRRALVLKQTVISDAQGAFALARLESYYNRLILVSDGKGQQLGETTIPSSYPRQKEGRTQTVFFTDRAIYRPGQMIFFKGLCLSADQDQNDYKVLPRRSVKVTFRDVNRQEVAVLNLRTNDFGSFNGTLNAPSDRLTGEMSIESSDPPGSAGIRVEEYKRPKFQVKLDVPEQEFRLNDVVAIPGEALAYTGAPVDGAMVKFRVLREVRYPWWWYYWYGRSSEGSQEIAHGTLRTDEAGKFKVEFQAKPDASVPASSNAIFTFSVQADVTDTTGETRSDEGSVRMGYAALEANLTCDEWQEEGRPVSIEAATTTLNGKKVAGKGEVEIYGLRGPEKPVPSDLIGALAAREQKALGAKGAKGFRETPDWKKWPEGPLVAKKAFETSAKADSRCLLSFGLGRGVYKARLKTKDKYGTPVESLLTIMVLAPAEKTFGVEVPFHAAAKTTLVEVGQTYEALWGTGYDRSPALVEVFQGGRRIKRSWTPAGETQGLIKIPVEERLRGGFTVIISLVKDNRIYRDETRVTVPWSNKALDVKWQTFRSKLRPGQKETWSLKVKGPGAALRAAEFVAALYDASLDQFVEHGFPGVWSVFRVDWTYVSASFANRGQALRTFYDQLNPYSSTTSLVYTHFPQDILEDFYGYDYPRQGMKYASARREGLAEDAVPAPMAAAAPAETMLKEELKVQGGVVGGVLGGVEGGGPAGKKAPAPDLSKVTARKNLNETAFFFPHLLTDKDGLVTLEFTMPEALTEWRFLGFAHTQSLESGAIEDKAVTQKELMVQPNPPRFMREGDKLEFTVKVTNMTEKEAAGAVELAFFDPASDKPLNAALGNTAAKKSFAVPAKQSRSFSWPVAVPDGLGVLGFKAVGATAEFSDGEEGMFPVLSRRILVQESLPLWISDKGSKNFAFQKLLKSGSSDSLKHLGLTVQMASNPAWYAIQALPFLMEYPYECSEQVFNRLYANALAQKIANSSPKIRRVFDLWKGTSALQSNLEKNQDLKSVLLEESPWVLEAQSETQAKRNVGLLFDENRMSGELRRALAKLEAMQLEDGSWPWFPGGPGNEYITLYIMTGFGRLKHLGVGTVSQDMAVAAVDYLDEWIDEVYQDILKYKTQNEDHLSSTIALYLYGRSFYLPEHPFDSDVKPAVDYFLKQAAKFWLELDCRQSQAHLALALNRMGDPATAQKIMRSMKERSQVDEELGRFWSELELSWWWYRAPIETQAAMIEAFDEVMHDQKAVEECKVWLLKQKQTQDWKTTKATADAVYGLILKGTDLLASDSIVKVSLGGKVVEPEKVEAGTGFYEKRYEPSAVVPAMGNIVVTKEDKGIAWGGVHWKYMEDISKITPHTQNPLRLKKSVFVQKQTKKGPVIEPVSGPVAVGDTLTIRIELRTDRDMEYVHMRDHRGSGLEPTNVLSQYKYQGGLVYYESTKDAATHFFIDYLPKGTYVFEYTLRVQLRGAYQNGMALIECMYAPEFNSHSESVKLEVK